MAIGGGTLFLGGEGDFIGPGHLSIFSANGSDWFGYHYYDGSDDGASRFNIRSIRWAADGWPLAGPPLQVPEPYNAAFAIVLGPLLFAFNARNVKRRGALQIARASLSQERDYSSKSTG
jgi:hypothetical protein